MRLRIQKATLFVLTTGLVLSFFAAGTHAADPTSAAYSNDPGRIFWIMHISDSHIGASVVEGANASENFAFALGEAYDVINPEVVVNTGDLCDGSINNIPATGQSVEEWSEYRTIVDSAGMTTDRYIDIPGNHDAYGESGDGQLTYYLAWSLNGSTFGKTTRSQLLRFPFGDYILYGTSTPNEGSNIFVEHSEFSPAELAELEAEISTSATAAAAQLVFVFGHHYLHQPDNGDQAELILQQAQAMYFHGHDHAFETYYDSDILRGQVDSMGKGDTNNIAVIAVDNNAVTYESTSTGDPWPFIVVTAPANRRLHNSEDSIHPYAYDVCRSGTANPIRALVFDNNTVTEVTFEPPGGPPVPMTRDPVEPRLWHGTWDASGLSEGETTLTVTATGTQTRSRMVHVMLADVECPEPYTGPPDAGVPDSGTTDATSDAGAPGADAQAPGVDGGLSPNADETGCACRASGSQGAPATLLLVVLLLGLARRRTR